MYVTTSVYHLYTVFLFIFQQSNNHIRISKIFKDNNLTAIEQTTLTGTKVIEALPVDADIKVNAMEIKTFKLTVC